MMHSRLPIMVLAALLAGCASDGLRDPDAASRMRIAASAESSGQMDVALSMYGAAAARDPDNVEAQTRFAAALVRAGNHAQAEQVLAAAVQRRPGDRALLVQLGRMRLRNGAAGEALSLFDRVLATDSRSVPALDGRGVALDLMGRHPEAQESYRRAQALDPNAISVANNLGLSLLLDGRPDEARAVLEPLARRADATQRVTANYAIALAATGQEAAARSMIGDADVDLRGVAESLRVNRQVIEVTPAGGRS
ncbi:tetratricopeptide repeat protein [Roseomonas eburnea]|uniref:Tetratricopeptide repeat protein n=1 Tax=Neoroseomonas eburnea TaxID=1346889 RepID=A0A9X9XA87_9PROT|nr:tetratricopeptide repeat protein [Neoroseomonas eburnea]MBR0680623.1 tetratricopeptide repeat protein [Neoroseomonas eburnea]